MITEIPRDEFIAEHWDYRPGEHVSFIEPTQQGKTFFMYQLLQVTVTRYPELRTVSLMPKPQDPATHQWAQEIGLKEIPDWPPPRRMPWQDKPAGYVLWPRHMLGADVPKAVNRAHLAEIFRRCLAEQYAQGQSLTVADDVYLHAVILQLNMDLEEFWTAGGAMKSGLWAANQKPSGTLGGGSVSSFSYNSPTHLILGKDVDARNVQRFSEIGGVDPKLVSREVRNLRMYRINGKNVSEKLYIHKGGPYMCRIGP